MYATKFGKFWVKFENWLWKDERKYNEMSRGNRRINTYFTT